MRAPDADARATWWSSRISLSLPAIQEELLGAYHAQLAQQRAMARTLRRQRARGPAEPPAPAADQAGDAPVG